MRDPGKMSIIEEIKKFNERQGIVKKKQKLNKCILCQEEVKEVDQYCKDCFEKLLDSYTPNLLKEKIHQNKKKKENVRI